MRNLKTFYRAIFFAMLVFFATPIAQMNAAASSKQTQAVNQETSLSPDDWKIVIDEKKASNEFGFIQKNLDSSKLADNGQFLLVVGIALLILSGLGVVGFSFCLYKLFKSAANKDCTKRTGTRYK